ncbi:MAG: tetratricopeptide repeat protein [Trueperaceae bacterium]
MQPDDVRAPTERSTALRGVANHGRAALLGLALLIATTVGATFAQQELSEPARIAYQEARDAMQRAIDADVAPYPDQPLWAEAIRKAREAVDAAPNDRRTLGLLAEVYSRSTFHARALNAWHAYLTRDYLLDAVQAPLFLEVSEEMAYAAYQRGNLQEAARIHMEVLDAVPFSKESRVWIARIRMEQERPVDAIPYWEAVVAQDPEDRRAAYFLALAEDQVRFGIEAADRFRAGVAHYEAGDLDAAARSFERATEANDGYAEAWAWRGRVAFERGSYLVAQRHYATAADLSPGNDSYVYFRNESQRRRGAQD